LASVILINKNQQFLLRKQPKYIIFIDYLQLSEIIANIVEQQITC